jgi:hypothetical protein
MAFDKDFNAEFALMLIKCKGISVSDSDAITMQSMGRFDTLQFLTNRSVKLSRPLADALQRECDRIESLSDATQ